jgi:hypothetical protein
MSNENSTINAAHNLTHTSPFEGKEIWILEDDHIYKEALAKAIRQRGAEVEEYAFVESMYRDLVSIGKYPDAFVIDLINPPTFLRGYNKFWVRAAMVVKFIAARIYLTFVFFPAAKRLKRILDAGMKDPKALQRVSYKELLCWPWGGLQLLAALTNPKLVPFNKRAKRPAIVVNSIKSPTAAVDSTAPPGIVVNTIMNVAAKKIWDMGKASDVVLHELIPRIDTLLRQKFGDGPDVSFFKNGYLAYVVKGTAPALDDQKNLGLGSEELPVKPGLESEVETVISKLAQVLAWQSKGAEETDDGTKS